MEEIFDIRSCIEILANDIKVEVDTTDWNKLKTCATLMLRQK